MTINTILKNVVRGVLSVLSKNKYKIVFESNSDFCDNSRAFYEYMLKNGYNKKYEFIWCVDDPKNFNFKAKQDANVKLTSFRSKAYWLSYLFHIATAKTVIYSHATPPFINIKKQTVACLWHGTPLKKMVYKDTGVPPFSFIISAGDWCKRALRECFHVKDSEILNLGYPRCDLLLEKNNSIEKLGIEKENYQKLLLWMPTFRKSEKLSVNDGEVTQTGIPLMQTAADLIELNQSLQKKEMFLIIKLHPLQDMKGIDLVSLSNIKMLTNDLLEEKDIQLYHLVSRADVLITDYSSVYFDYLLLNRPICFIVDDIDTYNERRGFVVENPLYFMPGAHVKTKAGLECFLTDMQNNKDNFERSRIRTCCITNEFTDNQSCERLANVLKLEK